MADLKLARARAAELVRKRGIMKPPVDAEPIARLQKVSILYATFDSEAQGTVSAYSQPSRVIFVSKDQPPQSKNYAIAHQLAHFVLRPDYVASKRYKVLLRDEFEAGNSTEEAEAHAFAAELLVPPHLLAQYKGMRAEDLVSRFVAPAEVIRSQLMAQAA